MTLHHTHSTTPNPPHPLPNEALCFFTAREEGPFNTSLLTPYTLHPTSARDLRDTDVGTEIRGASWRRGCGAGPTQSLSSWRTLPPTHTPATLHSTWSQLSQPRLLSLLSQPAGWGLGFGRLGGARRVDSREAWSTTRGGERKRESWERGRGPETGTETPKGVQTQKENQKP